MFNPTTSAAMSPQVEPPQKKKKTNPSLSFSSLPNEIIVDCLARMSRSYYPKLSLVCKTFRSLILSMELPMARFHLRTFETILHVFLQLSNDLPPSWFSLWIKPDQTLTNDIGKKQKLTGNTLLVPTPSSYYPRVPLLAVRVGSEYYALAQNNALSPVLWVLDKDAWLWRKASNMTVARERAVACVLDGRIYVMGGCGADETANWAEVFDPKTQTWEPLPDPGAEIRSSKIKKIEVNIGKFFLRCNEKKDYVYYPKQGKWDVAPKGFVCVIDKVFYLCTKKGCLWYDTKRREWREVRGLATLNRYRGGDFVDVANYNGKLLILWDKFAHQGRHCEYKNIWCAVIALERRNDDDEVWGDIEWASVVLTVPSSYVFLRSRLNTLI